MEPDQPQHDRPVAFVIAQQHCPATRALIPSWKNSGRGALKKFIILIFQFLKKIAQVKLKMCRSGSDCGFGSDCGSGSDCRSGSDLCFR